MDNNAVKQIQDIIGKSKSVGIAVPSDPTLDEMAAGLGLYLLFKTAGKDARIASASDPIVEVSSLVGIDKVGKTLAGKALGGADAGGDLTVSFPYTEGEIDKVSYTLEDGYLNIIVKASDKGLTFDQKAVEFSRSGGGSGSGPDVVISVGVGRIDDLDPLFDTQNMDIRIINIDNKKENEQFGDINLVSEKLSTLSEGIADLALALNMHIDQDAAQNLLNGISKATNNFQDPRTSSLAFEMASLLIKKGATREFSEKARQGITREQSQVSQPRAQQVQNQQVRTSPRQVQDTKDKVRFEEHLQRRVAEEKARESQRADHRAQPPITGQIVNDNNNIPSEDDAPNDWLAPKVYKGSSEV